VKAPRVGHKGKRTSCPASVQSIAPRRFCRLLLACATALITGLFSGSAQTLDSIRSELRNSLSSIQFAGSFAGLISLSDELELSGATYNIDNAVNTELSSLGLPFNQTFRPWGEGTSGIYIEGAIGRSVASESTADLYGGTLPALTTAADVRWISYGALVGAGLEFPVTDELTVTPILNLGLARIESDADYAGPGAGASAALLDGLAFNWDAWAFSAGGALRVDWVKPLGRGFQVEVIGRYDLRWTETFEVDDPAQEFSGLLQILTVRADLTGPTGLELLGRPLGWRILAAYRHFLEGDLFDIEEFVLLGGSLELDVAGIAPPIRAVTLSGGLIFGKDLTGYTFGVGVPF